METTTNLETRTFSLRVRTIDRREILVDASPSWSVGRLREELARDVPPAQIVLVSRGKIMSDDAPTLAAAGIEKDPSLVMMVKNATKTASKKAGSSSEKNIQKNETPSQTSPGTGSKTPLDPPSPGTVFGRSRPVPTFREGEVVQVDWAGGERFTGTILGGNDSKGYAVRWHSEDSATPGIPLRFIHSFDDDAEASSLAGMAESDSASLRRNVGLNEEGGRREEEEEEASVLCDDLRIDAFLSSPELEEALAPLKLMVQTDCDKIPGILEELQRDQPAMAALVLPFLVAELETENPRVLGEVMQVMKL